MALTPEQFDKLATKDDLKDFEDRMDIKMTQKIDTLLSAVDGLSAMITNHETEHDANQAAHDRIQSDVNDVRGHVGLEIRHPVLGPDAN